MIEITNDFLSSLKDKAEKAHKAPWSVETGFNDEICIMKSVEDDHSVKQFQLAEMKYIGTREDAEYMAAANPAVVLALIDHIKQMEKQQVWLAEQILCCSDENTYCTYDCDRCYKIHTVEGWLEEARKETSNDKGGIHGSCQ